MGVLLIADRHRANIIMHHFTHFLLRIVLFQLFEIIITAIFESLLDVRVKDKKRYVLIVKVIGK